MQGQAWLPTDKAGRYMTQLAKHWSHKFEVVLDATSARILLPTGVCTMRTHAEGLNVTVETANPESLTRLETVVEDHLLRFAFREPVDKLAWTHPATL